MLTLLHILCCLTLAGAAGIWLKKNGRLPQAHRFLFPYIAAATGSGIIVAYLAARELFVLHYSGGLVQFNQRPFGLTIEELLTVLIVTSLLPGFALLPWIGRRPLPVLTLATLALLPRSILLLSN